MSSDGLVDGAGGLGWAAAGHGQVDFVQVVVEERLFECVAGGEVLGDDEESGGVLVESVDDAGALFLVEHFGEGVVVVVEECVDEGSGEVAGGGVDDESGGLVEDEDVVVLEEDVEGDVLAGDGDVVGGGGPVDFDDVSGHGLGGLAADEASVEEDSAGVDALLEEGA